jgi:hypothetical protein
MVKCRIFFKCYSCESNGSFSIRKLGSSWSHSWQGVLDTALCDKVCQWLAAGRLFSPGTPVSPTNKTDLHDINWNIVENGVKYHTPKPVIFHHDRMVVRFTTTCAINVYHRLSCEFESCSWRGVLDTTVCDKFVSDLRVHRFSLPRKLNDLHHSWNLFESGVKHHNT